MNGAGMEMVDLDHHLDLCCSTGGQRQQRLSDDNEKLLRNHIDPVLEFAADCAPIQSQTRCVSSI